MPGLARALAIAGVLLVCAPSSVRAQKRGPAVAFTGPGESESARAVRAAASSFARSRGLGFHDLAEPAQPELPNRGADLDQAIADYTSFRYDQAIERLTILERALAETGGAGLSRRHLADVFIYRAMSRLELGQTAESRDDLVRAATIFPTYLLDEGRFRPTLRDTYERARAAVAANPPAIVVLDLDGSCAVTIDGEPSSPASKVSLRPGTHFVRAACPGFAPSAGQVNFGDGEHRFAPPMSALPDSRASALTAASAASDLIWIAASDKAPEKIVITLIDVATRADVRTWTLSIKTAAEVTQLDDVLSSLIETEFSAPTPPPLVIEKSTPRAWYERPWLYVAVGAVAATAIILPFALSGGDGGGGFDANIEGLP